MGRRLFARFGFSCSVALLSIVFSTPVHAGQKPDGAAVAPNQTSSNQTSSNQTSSNQTSSNQTSSNQTSPNQSSPVNDLEAASTLDLTGLQGQFSKVADVVSPSVVAISASCT